MNVVFSKDGTYSKYAGFQFAHIKRDDNHMTGYPIDCKEIFADSFHNGNRLRVSGRRFRFMILLTDPRQNLDAQATQDLLNQVEAEMGFGLSKVYFARRDGVTQALVVDASIRWLVSCPVLHVLLVLARNGSAHKIGRTWQQTLAKFRRVDAFKKGDAAQFLVAREAISHVIAQKGHITTFGKMNRWGRGTGICQWAGLQGGVIDRNGIP